MIEWENLTAQEWELYTHSMKCGHAARSLNAAMRRATKAAYKEYKKTLDLFGDNNISNQMWEVYSKEVSPVQSKYSDFGAQDSEINWKVDDWFAKIKEDLIERIRG